MSELRPLQSRILVKPDEPTAPSTRIIIPETVRKDPPMSGEVVAIGRGPASARHVRSETIAECIGIVEELVPHALMRNQILDAFAAKQLEAGESEVCIGDTVVFAYTSGSTLTVDGEKFIVLNEDDCLAVIPKEEVAA